jgi:PPP family 3-phenylpropionic acid transporter
MIGFILALPIMVRILVTAPLLSLQDRGIGARRLLIVGHAGQIAGFPLLLVADHPAIIAALVGAMAVFQAAIIPGNDLVTTNAVRRFKGLNYGRLRSFGSIAFLGASIAAGYLLDAFGAQVVPWALALTPALAVLATVLAVPPHDSPRAEAQSPERPEAPARLPAALWLVMIAGALIQGSHGAIYAFGSIHWRSLGISDALIGYFWAIGVVAEIVVFYLLGRGVGRGSAGFGLLLVGSSAAVIRLGLMSQDPGPLANFLLQSLHGLSFGASHLGAIAALTALAPDAARGRAQGLLASFTALGTASTTLVSGEIYRALGPGVFAVMAPLGAVAFVLTLVAMRLARGQPGEAARKS